MNKLTEQFFDDPERYRDPARQRIYLKDIDCPQVWHDKLKEHIPAALFYLNDSTGVPGGPGALDKSGGRKGQGIGRAGDLMSCLPPEMRAENLMCYIGHEGTYTPSHREMCASLGQNIMVNASSHISEDGNPERPGSSIWFMTEMKDRHLVSEYWLSVLGHDIEVENHFAQLIAWKKAPFKTYVVDQRPGDLILIPPLAPHQVWNRGTRTMKIAWNRTTVETLKLALDEALPNSRIVCRDEQYKNKAIVYYTLQKYSSYVRVAQDMLDGGGARAEAVEQSVRVQWVQRDFRLLLDLYKSILLSEMFAPDSREHPELLPFDSNVTCSYCRCNIFNRFLSCKTCKNMFNPDVEEPYDVCMDCFCMGRSCGCRSGYAWVEQWKWKDLLHKYEEWRAQIIELDGEMTERTPLALPEERRYLGKKTLAQVCQEQLKIRPFVDIKNPQPEEASDDEGPVVDEFGNVKKITNKKSRQWLSKHKSCHICYHRHPKWRMALCSNCDLAYCYGSLFRAHDLMPLAIMENPNWKCPHCMKVCSKAACRRDPRQNPYQPKGTLLGHDTKKVADPRSEESLVDFSVSNLNWIREEEGMGQSAMQRRLQQAEMDKMEDPSLDARYKDVYSSARNGITYSPSGNGNGEFDQNGDGYQDDAQGSPDPYYQGHDIDGEIPRLGQKRRLDAQEDEEVERRRKKPKKRKKTAQEGDDEQTPQSRNAPGKQYQKEVQKKLLDEAKRDDRLILVTARMKNKSKIVQIPLRPEWLQQVQQRQVFRYVRVIRQTTLERDDTPGHVGSILQSDILPSPSIQNTTSEKEKGTRKYRVRVEEDETYSTRKRGVDGPSKSGTRGSQRFEEITLEPDEDFGSDDEEAYTGRDGGRASRWLARKNGGEDDSFTELPEDFRDGDLRNAREKERDRIYYQQKKSLPAKPTAGVRPVGRPPKKPLRNSTNNAPDDNDINETQNLAQAAAFALERSKRAEQEKADAAAAAKEVEENLRAKMALYSGSEDESNLVDDFLGDLPADDQSSDHEVPPETDSLEATTPYAARLPPVQSGLTSINERSMTRANGDTATTTKIAPAIASPATKRRNAAKKGQTIDISDSESEDEVSVPSPVAKKPMARRPGRPSMKPTRGAGIVRRGRSS